LSGRLLFAVALLGAVPNASGGERRPAFASVLRFSATDTRDRIEGSLGRDLLVRARRDVDAEGRPAGWYLEAVDRRRPDSPNFLYECLCGHGPQPMDFLAWHLLQPDAVAHLGPLTERRLPVWGYPYELRVRCEDCEATGDDAATDARFVKGTIEVGGRLLAESNPRQKRPADFRR
jgi:hypothetical protein